MTNLEFVYPKKGVSSPFNNTFIVTNPECKNVFLKISDNEYIIPTQKVNSLKPGVEYCGISNFDDYIKYKQIEELIYGANRFTYNNETGPLINAQFTGDNYDRAGVIYSEKDIEVLINISGRGVCIINNVFIWESTKIKIPKDLIMPVRIITGRGDVTFNNEENIFFIPKEKNE